jgi:VanZ family protein
MIMAENQSRSRARWGWPILLAFTVFHASGQGAVAAPDIVSIDKIGHFGVFGLLATLIARTQPRSRWWMGVLLASLYGICDEFRQSLTPGRSVEFADWVADTTGAAFAVTIYAKWDLYRRLMEKKLWGRTSPQVAKEDSPVSKSAE